MVHEFRDLTADDAQAFIDLDIEMFGADAWPEAMAEYYLDSDRIIAIGMDGEDGLDAAAMLGCGPEAEILTISVRHKLRRQGVATEMIRHLIDRAVGADAIFLEVRSKDEGAQSLYTNLGFKPVGRRANYYTNDDAIIMRRNSAR